VRMSIINDAIKKAGKEFSASKEGQREILPGGENLLGVELAGEPKKKRLDFTVAAIALFVFVAGSIFLYKNMARFTAKPLPAAESGERSPAQYTAIQEDLRKAARALKVETAFDLNGIMSDGSDKWAIIDNRIVNEGDVVSGGQITSISNDFVTVRKKNGSETVLYLK
ncbi:MAG: hypothetical protein WC569_06730, partial [Candidatus Omnitrophota bacterium]